MLGTSSLFPFNVHYIFLNSGSAERRLLLISHEERFNAFKTCNAQYTLICTHFALFSLLLDFSDAASNTYYTLE